MKPPLGGCNFYRYLTDPNYGSSAINADQINSAYKQEERDHRARSERQRQRNIEQFSDRVRRKVGSENYRKIDDMLESVDESMSRSERDGAIEAIYDAAGKR